MLLWEETGESTIGTHRGRGPGTQGKICRGNVGKGQLPAGTGNNLQRPTDEASGWRKWEGIGLAHEPV